MKNEEKLLYTIGEVDAKLVPSDKMKKSPLKWAVIGTSAAAAAVAGFVVMRGADFSNLPSIISPFDGEGVDIVETEDILITDDILTAEDISDSSDIAPNGLPKIPYKSFRFNSGFNEESLGNMGYNSATSMIRDCPWSEEQGITTLPVYKNLSYGGDYVYPDAYLNEEKMMEMAEEIAEALGVTIREYEFSNDFIDTNGANDENLEYIQEANCLSAICDGESYGVEAVKIYIYGRGSIGIALSDLIQNSNPTYMKLPEEYANDEEALSDYLMEHFGDLINMENPSGSALDKMYNVTDDPVQNIVNYSLEAFEFNIHNNELMGMNIDKKLCVAEKVGDYEIITAEEAQSKLLSAYKNFKLPDDWPDEFYDHYKKELTEEDIESVTLYYKDVPGQEYFKPYYCFYVKESSWSPDNDWDVYQAFYVPALRDEYILN